MIVHRGLGVLHRQPLRCQAVSRHRRRGVRHIALGLQAEVGRMSLREVAVKRVEVEGYESRT